MHGQHSDDTHETRCQTKCLVTNTNKKYARSHRLPAMYCPMSHSGVLPIVAAEVDLFAVMSAAVDLVLLVPVVEAVVMSSITVVAVINIAAVSALVLIAMLVDAVVVVAAVLVGVLAAMLACVAVTTSTILCVVAVIVREVLVLEVIATVLSQPLHVLSHSPGTKIHKFCSKTDRH